MTNEERDRVYEVVWNGEEGLTADRETKPSDVWTPPKRLYNKKSEFWTKKREPTIINPLEDDDVGGEEVVLRDSREG